ncbi:MAG: prevent-host-death family protein [Candidatus Azotimanducaceae bacterium]|jgi:prevent-host-death family protein
MKKIKTFNVHDAKTHFSKILRLVETGEEELIARAGQEIVKLVPVNKVKARELGFCDITISNDFDDEISASNFIDGRL